MRPRESQRYAHQVRPRGRGFVGGCKDDDGTGCDDVLLTKEEIEVWVVNLSRLGRAIAQALKCDAKDAKLGLDGTRQIASLGDAPLPVVLTVQHDGDGFGDVVAQLVARFPKGFVLLAPTSRFCTAPATELLGRVNAGFFSLESQVMLTAQGNLQARKRGLTVTWLARNGLVHRILVTPKNPRTDKQMSVRELFSEQARRFDALTGAQQDAWIVAAADYQSTPTLGQSGPLTGLQLFLRINCKLGLLGQTLVDMPPSAPQFPTLAPQNLFITNTGGVVAVRLTCPTDPGETTVLRASPPQKSATRACRNFRIIGVCPAAGGGAPGCSRESVKREESHHSRRLPVPNHQSLRLRLPAHPTRNEILAMKSRPKLCCSRSRISLRR